MVEAGFYKWAYLILAFRIPCCARGMKRANGLRAVAVAEEAGYFDIRGQNMEHAAAMRVTPLRFFHYLAVYASDSQAHSAMPR